MPFIEEHELIEELQRRVNKEGSIRKYALKHGVSYSGVSNILRYKTPLTPKIARSLGNYEKVTVWETPFYED